MELYLALLAGYGKEYLGDAVADVVADDVFDEEVGEQYAYGGEEEVLPVGAHGAEVVGEEGLDFVYSPFEDKAGEGGSYAYDEGYEKEEAFVGEALAVVPAPPEEGCYGVAYGHLMIFMVLS